MFKQHIHNNSNFEEDWFTYKNLYIEMVRKYPSGSTFVEIGSWKGKSSAFMTIEIENSLKNIDFCCVDTFQGSAEHSYTPENLYEIFVTNMKPMHNFYRVLQMSSLEASKKFENNSVDFIFLDASHEYGDVVNDILNWLPKLKHGGTLAGHDYNVKTFPGVVRAAIECLPKYRVDTEQKCYMYSNE